MQSRFTTLALSLSLVLGLTGSYHLFAQGDDKDKKDAKPAASDKKDEAPKPAATEKKDETAKPAATDKKDETAKPAEAKKEEPPKEAPLPTIPPEVEEKLEKARRAVAEAIVAAQDAGLVETSIDPPPIVEILTTGRALDVRGVKSHMGVSPEVFGAWFTGHGKLEGFTAAKDVRIVQPSDGLKELFDRRSEMLSRHIKAVRDAKLADAAKAKDDDAKKEAAMKAAEAKKKADDETAAKKKAADEAAAKKEAAMKKEAEAKKKADDEAAAKKKADEAAKKEAAMKKEAEVKKKADDEAAAKKKAADEAKKKEDAAKKKAADEAKKKAEADKTKDDAKDDSKKDDSKDDK